MAKRKNHDFVVFFGVFILMAGFLGFGYKLLEMIQSIFDSETYRFTLTPVLTYLCVAAGFFCIVLVQVLRGIFKDIERPKYRMLEMEAEYDAQEEREAVLALGRPDREVRDGDDDSWWKGDVHK